MRVIHPDSLAAGFDRELKTTSEVNDFLQCMHGMNFPRFSDYKDNSYQSFFVAWEFFIYDAKLIIENHNRAAQHRIRNAVKSKLRKLKA